MTHTIYGLTQLGNRYYYAIHDQAFVVQLKPRPIAWRKTPSTSWERAHGDILRLDMLGLGILELDPIAEFDRSSSDVFRLVPSDGQFQYEVDWNDGILFTEWTKDSNWREIVSGLMDEVEPKVLEKLREFSHFHWRLLVALDEWPGFANLLDANPALAVCIAGRIRVGGREGKRRPQLDYRGLAQRSEREIATALGFGDSDAAVSIMRKMVPDACKALELVGLPKFLENRVVRKALLNTDVITYPALLFLRNPFLSSHLTGGFLTELSRIFPRSLDILTCPWGPLLRGGGKGDQFTWKYQQALDVVQFAEDPTIYSIEDLENKHWSIFLQRTYHTLPDGETVE